MTTAKIAITLPVEMLQVAREQVEQGGAPSLSAFITQAVGEKLRRDSLEAILDAMDASHGKPSKAARSWAKRVLER